MSLGNKQEIQKQVAQLSKVTATALVNRVLKKHGVNKTNVKTVSNEERAKIKRLVSDLKEKSDSLTKKL